jgi:diphthine-ammonia ligase
VSHAAILPDHHGGAPGNELVSRTNETDEDEHDLNSFMYQTVGHQVIPLYAEATGIPLYRQAITGGAAHHGKDYFRSRRSTASGPGGDAGPAAPDRRRESGDRDDTPPEEAGDDDPDETESMIPLLRAIKKAHPEANAICAGAILSTYQRTRVESVALRLGLTPLAYLWKFPTLPVPGPADPVAGSGDAQLLDDMAAVGLEARIIKVASGGLDDSFLWTDVASAAGKARLARAMRRFGAAETGAVIGEGGEFETLVLDGPPALFRRRIVVVEEDRRVVREGGGSAWLSLRGAGLEEKGEEVDGSGEGGAGGSPRVPDLLDPRFVAVLDVLSSPEGGDSGLDLQASFDAETENTPRLGTLQASASEKLQQWSFVSSTKQAASNEAETRSIVDQIRHRLQQHALPPSAILNATVLLRRMADFPAVNAIYSTLFDGAPNPPSRVTISCGDALSSVAAAADAADVAIAVHLTVHTAAEQLLQPGLRQGLHVQSRSYWAPANIGPYSQAISVPLASLEGEGTEGEERDGDGDVSSGEGTARLVSVAGQIPLVPATMELPPLSLGDGGAESEGDSVLRLQLALSLQHLWRIGGEVGVQWWSSAVAYFPASASASVSGEEETEEGKGVEMAAKARLASRAWRAAHVSASDNGDEDEEDDENGPDLWDRRYNPEYMTFAGGDGGEKTGPPALPDRSVLRVMETSKDVVPPLFAAEVDELPRGAGVEWHAHLGVACAREGSVGVREMRLAVPASEGKEVAVSQIIVGSGEGGGVRFVQTVVAEGFGGGGRLGGHGQAARVALGQLGDVGSAGELAAVVRYVDVGVLRAGEGERVVGPMVPCRSLWNGRGERLAAVTVYQSVFE